MQLIIEKMTCGGCARGVTASIQSIDPDAKVDIDVAKKTVDLTSTADINQILVALAEDGFPAVIV